MVWLWKWLVRALAVLAVVVLGTSLGVYWMSQSRLEHKFAVSPAALPLTFDTATLERGRHLATIRGCIDCHGANLAGRIFLDDPMIGRFVASNLTSGKGGVGATYTDVDWLRAIRHGVRPDGRALLIMPADEYFHLSDADTAAVIAYVKRLPPIDNELPVSAVSPGGRAIMTFDGAVPILPAERINHAAPRPEAPTIGVTVEYGRYLATSCVTCHGETFSGGRIPGVPPRWPAASNLTPLPGTAIARWTEREFARSLRTGVTPEGRSLDERYMPWKAIGQMTDDEIRALWMFLRSLTPKPTGLR